MERREVMSQNRRAIAYSDYEWLTKELHQSGLSLKTSKRNDPKLLSEIRNWVAKWTHICVDPNPRSRKSFLSGSGGDSLRDILVPDDYWRWSIRELHAVLTNRQYGVLCGGGGVGVDAGL